MKNVDKQTFSVPNDIHCIFVYTIEVDGNQNSLVINILHNFFFCVPSVRSGLKQHEGEYMMTEY